MAPAPRNRFINFKQDERSPEFWAALERKDMEDLRAECERLEKEAAKAAKQ